MRARLELNAGKEIKLQAEVFGGLVKPEENNKCKE